VDRFRDAQNSSAVPIRRFGSCYQVLQYYSSTVDRRCIWRDYKPLLGFDLHRNSDGKHTHNAFLKDESRELYSLYFRGRRTQKSSGCVFLIRNTWSVATYWSIQYIQQVVISSTVVLAVLGKQMQRFTEGRIFTYWSPQDPDVFLLTLIACRSFSTRVESLYLFQGKFMIC
jgi:hypothetical protein